MLTSMFAQIMASWPPPSPKIFMFTRVMTSWPPLSHTKFIKKTIGGIRYYKKSNIIPQYAFKYCLNGIIPVYRPALIATSLKCKQFAVHLLLEMVYLSLLLSRPSRASINMPIFRVIKPAVDKAPIE